MRNQSNTRKATKKNQSAPKILAITHHWKGFFSRQSLTVSIEIFVCIVNFNRIAYLGLVAEPFLILIRGEVFPHLGLMHCSRYVYSIDGRFWCGGFCFISIWFDQFITHKPYMNCYKKQKNRLWHTSSTRKHWNTSLPMYLNWRANIRFKPQWLWMHWIFF